MTASPYLDRHPSRPCQGSIYRNIKVLQPMSPLKAGPGDQESWHLPYAVVLSQECDLDQDQGNREKNAKDEMLATAEMKHDKLLPTVLFCPAYQAAPFRDGKHLEPRRMEKFSGSRWELILENKNPRYHYLVGYADLQMPELVLDFKHYFVLPMELLTSYYNKPEYSIARLAELYREDLSQRFAAYLGRIGLPTPHHKLRPEGE